jgi:glycosyltransferase involved in cell wall biosynthesis
MDSPKAEQKPPLLILAYVYPPDNYAGAARPYRFAKYLERLGHSVIVVASGAQPALTIEGNVYRVPGEQEGRRRSFEEKVLRTIWLPQDEGIRWVPRVVSLAARWKDKQPVLLSTSPPLTTHLAALWLKLRYGWKWIADFRDPLVGNPFRKERRVMYLDRILERLFFRYADALIANTDPVAELWRARYPQRRRKVHVLWNGFDPEDEIGPRPLPTRPYRVLAHVGSMYGDRHPNLVLSSVARLVQQGRLAREAVRIQLTGPVSLQAQPDPRWAESLREWGCLEINAKLVPRADAGRLISEADQLLLLDVLNAKAGLQVPGKLFEYVRIGRPILASTTEDSPVERILKASGVPYTCIYENLSETEIDRRVLAFLNLPVQPVSPSPWFYETFSAGEQARKLSALVEG